MVPKMSAHLMPTALTRIGEKKQDTTIKQKVSALAPLTRYGFAAPPAPREFIAPQIPGASKLHIPRIRAL